MKNLLSKVLLLVLFAFSDCEMIRGGFNNTINTPDDPTPSEALVALIGDNYLSTDGQIKIELFYISDDAKKYKSYEVLNFNDNTLYYVDGGDNWATYEGETSQGYVEVKLKDIVENSNFSKGYFTMYIDGKIHIDGIFL